jgi:hypothetical protein
VRRDYLEKPLRCALGFEPLGPVECLLQAIDGRGGNALLFGISFVAGIFGSMNFIRNS